jgi:hypothetical protein
MFKDTAHTAEEFANFPWDQLNDEWFEKVGGFSIGGITAGVDFNGPPHKWTITFHDENANKDRWEIPPVLTKLIQKYKERGAQDAQTRIRNALGLTNDSF